MSEVTRILSEIEQGERDASEQLLPLVYDELRKLAAARLAHEQPGQTLEATALVHDAYIRLVGSSKPKGWDGRGHFFAAAAEAMRRILVENARRNKRLRHGGERRRVDFTAVTVSIDADDHDILDLNEAFERLKKKDATAAETVQLRFFAGLTIEEAACAQGISVRTANRNWAFARAWLYQQLHETEEKA